MRNTNQFNNFFAIVLNILKQNAFVLNLIQGEIIMTKPKKIIFISLSIIFAVISIFMIFWYFGDSYHEFYSISSKEFKIMGLDEGFTPQGLCYESDTEKFLTCGYMKNGSASRIYVVDKKKNKTDKYFTLRLNADIYTGHAGGIATNGISVWIVGDGMVHRFDYFKVQTVENGGIIDIVDSFETKNGADFVTVENNNLWVGEFHKKGKYDTSDSHFIETETGSTNSAISFCYEISDNEKCGITSLVPTKALSTGSLVQGMVVLDDKIILSTSYSLANSHIYTYENILSGTASTFNFEGTEIPLFILSDKQLIKDLETPCMSEEITVAEGKIYIMFESACQKYRLFTREPLYNSYSYKI